MGVAVRHLRSPPTRSSCVTGKGSSGGCWEVWLETKADPKSRSYRDKVNWKIASDNFKQVFCENSFREGERERERERGRERDIYMYALRSTVW